MKTFIDHKFEIGQKVFYLDSDKKCKSFEIDKMTVSIEKEKQQAFYYKKDSYFPFLEDELYATEADVNNHVFGDLIDFV